jgi:tRNA (uracil-5-)-methyltransferase
MRIYDDLELKQVQIDSINSRLEGISNQSNLEFRYVDIGDKVSFYELGRGENKYPKIQSIERKNIFLHECNFFSKCGGCISQHLSYERQFQYKTENYTKRFKEQFAIELELIPAEKKFTYRNRMDFAVFPEKIGLRQMSNFRNIIDIDECKIQSNWANSELKILRTFLNENFPEISYNRKTETGFLKYITLRDDLESKDSMSIFTFTKNFLNTELEEKLISEIVKYSTAQNIIFCYSRKQSEVSCDGESKLIKGRLHYNENFLGKNFIVPFNSFSQPNLNGFLPIIKFIESIILENKASTLIDLFCGNGFFSLLFGEYFEKVYGFDLVESSIEIASQNFQINFPDKDFSFEKKDLLSVDLDFSSMNKNSILILDPPRNGIGKKIIDTILQSDFENILYVSCNPKSQLDDLEHLKNKYKIHKGLLTDPFPQTTHLESVVFLKRI